MPLRQKLVDTKLNISAVHVTNLRSHTQVLFEDSHILVYYALLIGKLLLLFRKRLACLLWDRRGLDIAISFTVVMKLGAKGFRAECSFILFFKFCKRVIEFFCLKH
jgi:hypothetical protein